jgi:putative endonuclease
MADPRHDLGQRGERLAEDLLVREGARVLARNFRTRAGELDLVVEQDGDLVGVEVKTRRPGQPALPEEAVNGTRLGRLERALTQFAQEHGHEDAGWRIDVVAIEVDQNGTVRRLEHIRDAFGG